MTRTSSLLLTLVSAKPSRPTGHRTPHCSPELSRTKLSMCTGSRKNARRAAESPDRPSNTAENIMARMEGRKCRRRGDVEGSVDQKSCFHIFSSRDGGGVEQGRWWLGDEGQTLSSSSKGSWIFSSRVSAAKRGSTSFRFKSYFLIQGSRLLMLIDLMV